MPTIYDARKFLHELQDEYQRKVADASESDLEHYDLAEECLDGIANPIDEFLLLWASGAMDTAMDAARDEILDAIRSTNRDYAY